MHRCLKISELFQIICENSRKQELYRLSLTCRSFCSLALDALWYKPSCIANLLFCFPDGVIQRNSPWFSLLRVPKPNEWERVRLYAGRIRILPLATSRFAAHDECYHLFLDHWPYDDQVIFPNIHGAELVPGHDIKNLICAKAMQARPLRYLKTTFSLEDEEFIHDSGGINACFDSFFTINICFGSGSGTVEDLFFDLPDVEPGQITGLTDYINGHLRTFHVLRKATLTNFPLSSDTLSHFALLPDLTSLSFTYSHKYSSSQLLAPHPHNFRHLRTLVLQTDMVKVSEGAAAVLTNMHPTTLEELCICMKEVPLAVRLLDMIRAIARFTSLHSLTLHYMDFDYDADEWVPDDPEDWPIQCSPIFSALSPLGELRSFDISYVPLHVTPTDITSLTRLWPKLETLCLDATEEYTTTAVCAVDVPALAAKFPCLRELMLPALSDASPVGGEDDVEHPRIVSTEWRAPGVRKWAKRDPPDLASIAIAVEQPSITPSEPTVRYA